MATKIMGLVAYNVAYANAYLRTKWHLDPSSRLATIHQRYRQTERQDRTDNGPIAYTANRFASGRPKTLRTEKG